MKTCLVCNNELESKNRFYCFDCRQLGVTLAIGRGFLRESARSKLHRAKIRGAVIPQPCYFCRSSEVEAHHFDYSLELVVFWLCRSCHTKLHNIERAKKKAQEAVE